MVDSIVGAYCMLLDKVGDGLIAVGAGAHQVYELCGQGLQWVATLGGMCCPPSV